MLPNKPCLIIAQSGRALAASAAQANIKTHVIDRFADEDTRGNALSTRLVAGNVMGLCAGELLDAFNDYTDKPLTGVVVGSGLESRPELLDVINARAPLLGNLSDCVKLCKDPARFFAILDSFGISHPEIRLNAPDYTRGWLVKHIGGSGGQHISCYMNSGRQLPDQYFQRFIHGQSISVVFIGNRKKAQVIGLNKTWARAPENFDFCYSGAATLPEIDEQVYTTIGEIASLLVKHLELAGLCGIDIILGPDGECHVLEVNPRPPATFELHERGNSLFHAHVMACKGHLIPLPQKNVKSCGHEILFAPFDFHIPEIVWPGWVVDRPGRGLQIACGEPICTIRAAANTPAEVQILLERRKSSMNELLGLQQIAA